MQSAQFKGHKQMTKKILGGECSGGACELDELGLEERDDGGVLVVLGDGKGSDSIGCCEARICSGSKEGLDCLHMALCTRSHEGSLA